MKIALLVPGGVDRGGRERVIPALLWLIERMAQCHQVRVVALRQEPRPSRYPLLGAQVINLGRVGGRAPGIRLLQRLRRLLAALDTGSQPFDVLHAFWAGETGVLAGIAGRLLRVPVVLSIAGGELVWLPEIGYGDQGRWRGRTQVALALRLARAITVGSRHACALLGPRGRDAHWVPLGADRALFDAPVQRSAAPPWRLLCVASINRVKDPATLLRALRLTADQQPHVRLDWVGEDLLDGAMQRMASALGLSSVVRFHSLQPVDAIVPLYRSAHLYVQSSLHESQGVAVVEAATAGLPTVGTAVGLVAELAPVAAISVPTGDAPALAQAILTLLEDPGKRERIGRAAQAWAQAHDADWTAAQFEALYEWVHA